MSVSAEVWQRVRERAHQTCEYCGITEVDAGGLLTIDHLRPSSENGYDTADNLAYACHRCNEYKGAYWPKAPGELPLWNPRLDTWEEHFIRLMDGVLLPLSPTAAWTLQRLRLNRPALVAHRIRHQVQVDRERQLHYYQDTLRLLSELLEQQVRLQQEQGALLQEFRRLLLLLGGESPR